MTEQEIREIIRQNFIKEYDISILDDKDTNSLSKALHQKFEKELRTQKRDFQTILNGCKQGRDEALEAHKQALSDLASDMNYERAKHKQALIDARIEGAEKVMAIIPPLDAENCDKVYDWIRELKGLRRKGWIN